MEVASPLTVAEVEAMEARQFKAVHGDWSLFAVGIVEDDHPRLLRSWRAQRETLLLIKELVGIAQRSPHSDPVAKIVDAIAAEVADVE